MIALIDYGAGNLASVRKGMAAVGAPVVVVREPGDVASASAIVIPGVGHFEATATLDAAWRQAIAVRHPLSMARVASKLPTPGTMTPAAGASSAADAGVKTSAPTAPSALRTDVRLPAP